MKPVDYRTVGKEEILFTWEDGHRSLYAFPYLRLQCPCAGCRDEWTGKRMIQPSQIAPEVHPRQVENVGNYALRFHWSDGHQTGIYGFQFLRDICPCETCHQERHARQGAHGEENK